MGLADDMKAFKLKTNAKHEKIVRGTTIALFNAVIMDTPVDEGRLRGDWQTTVGQPATGNTGIEDKAGAAAMAEVTKNTPSAVGIETHLTNNMPYCEVVENGDYNGPTELVTADGYSKKAPQGMVKKNVDRFKKLIEEQARKTT